MWAARLLLQVAVVEAAIFQPNGKIHLTSGNLLVTANINTRPFTRRCQETSKAVASIPTRPNLPEQHIKTHISRVINDTCDQIKGWPSLEDRGREKRQLLAAAGAIFGGLAVELWHRWTGTSTRELESHVAKQDHRLLELAKITQKLRGFVQRQEQTTIQIEALLKLYLVARQYERIIDWLTRGISTLVAVQRVTTDLLPPEVANAIWRQVQRALRHRGQRELRFPGSLLYECKASYFYDISTINVVFELPIVHASYELFHKTNHPTWLPGHERPLVIGGQAYFAVAEDAHNFVTPREELAGCSAIGEHKFCPLEVARSDWAEHCLAALFKGLWKEALAICEVSTFKGRWAAERTSHKRFDVVVTADTPFRTRCSSNGTISVDGVWRPGQHNVTVESSCFVSTASFSLHGAVSNGVRVAVQPATDWLSAAEATQALEERQVRQKEAEDVLAGRLAGAMDDMKKNQWRGPSPWPVALAVGVASMVALAVGAAWLRRRRRRSKKRPATTSTQGQANERLGGAETRLATREMDD